MERYKDKDEFKKMSADEKMNFLAQFSFTTEQLSRIRQVLLRLNAA